MSDIDRGPEITRTDAARELLRLARTYSNLERRRSPRSEDRTSREILLEIFKSNLYYAIQTNALFSVQPTAEAGYEITYSRHQMPCVIRYDPNLLQPYSGTYSFQENVMSLSPEDSEGEAYRLFPALVAIYRYMNDRQMDIDTMIELARS